MGTLSSAFTSVRIRIKDTYKIEFSDEDLLDLTTEIMDQVFEALSNLESNLILQPSTITLEADVNTYSLGDVQGLTDGSVWIDDPDNPLGLVMTPVLQDAPTDTPTFFQLDSEDNIIFYPTPNAAYTVTLTYSGGYTAPTVDTFDAYDFPWQGLWNRAIIRALVLECLSILERSIGVAAAQAGSAWDEAMIRTYARGRIQRTNRGRLFYGI